MTIFTFKAHVLSIMSLFSRVITNELVGCGMGNLDMCSIVPFNANQVRL